MQTVGESLRESEKKLRERERERGREIRRQRDGPVTSKKNKKREGIGERMRNQENWWWWRERQRETARGNPRLRGRPGDWEKGPHRCPAVGSRRMGCIWPWGSKSSPVLGPLRLEQGPATYLLLLEASRYRSGLNRLLPEAPEAPEAVGSQGALGTRRQAPGHRSCGSRELVPPGLSSAPRCKL